MAPACSGGGPLILSALVALQGLTFRSVPGLVVWADAARSSLPVKTRMARIDSTVGPKLYGIGPVLTPEGPSKTFRYDGAGGSFADGPSQGQSGFTVCAVVRPTVVNRRMGLVVGQGSVPWGVRLGSDGRFAVHVGSRLVRGTARWASEETAVLTTVVGDGRIRLYVNGLLDAEGTAETSGIVPNARFGLGAWFQDTERFRGDVSCLVAYGRALPASERDTVEGLMAARGGLALRRVHVSTAPGTTGTGLLASDPAPTVAAALARLGPEGGTVVVDAPANRPLRETVRVATGTPVVLTAPEGARWCAEGSDVVTSGWTRWNANLWSRPIAVPSGGYPVVTTSPRSPSRQALPFVSDPYRMEPGTVGKTATSVLVRLAGDANPNGVSLGVGVREAALLIANGTAPVRVERADLVGGFRGAALAGQEDVASDVTFVDCTATGGGVGFGTRFGAGTFRFERCSGDGNVNDGFNLHMRDGGVGTATMVDCMASRNGDEGVSPHGAFRLTLTRGRFLRNASSGLAAVGTSRVEATDTLFEENNLGGNPDREGGALFTERATGRLVRCTFRNNRASGFYRAVPSAVNLSRCVSTGNGRKDR